MRGHPAAGRGPLAVRRRSVLHQGERASRTAHPPLSDDDGISPCGVWLALSDADYIFYEDGTTRLHREHIVLHELGHVLSDHVPTDLLDEEVITALMPDLDLRMVQRVLGRTSYSAVEEQEAEMLASLVLENARRATVARARTAAPEVANVLDRLESTLKGRAG